MIEGGEKLRLRVVCMSAWCVWAFCMYLYLVMLAAWDTNLVRAILSTIPFLLVFLVHFLCLYLYMSNKISSFVANPQTTTRIPTIILMNYLPVVIIYIIVHGYVLYHILEEVTPEHELRSIVGNAFMFVFWSIGMVFWGCFGIDLELKSYQVKQQSATTTPTDQQHMTEGRDEKQKLIEMVKHTSLSCFIHVLCYLIPLIFLMWVEEDMVDKKPQVFRAAVLYFIPILFIWLITLIRLRRYTLECINISFDEINPQSTTTRERIVAGNAKKHFAATAITFGVHLFILYILSDEVTRKNEVLQLLLNVGFLLSMSYLQIVARFSYSRLASDSEE